MSGFSVVRIWRSAAIVASASFCVLAASASAQNATITWTGSSNSLWSNGANWSTGIAPGAGADVVLTNAGTAPSSNDQSPAYNSITLGPLVGGFTINSVGGHAIALTGGGGTTCGSTANVAICENNTAALSPIDTINAGLILNGTTTIMVAPGGADLVLQGAITGSGPLTLNAGTLGGNAAIELSVANSYSGPTIVNANGSGVRLDVNGAIPTGSALTVNGFGTDGYAEFMTSSSIASLTGAGHVVVINHETLTVGSDNTNTVFSGVISDSTFGVDLRSQGVPGGALMKIGTGTLTLSGANNYFAGTTISAGTLQIGAGGTTGSILGNVVNNGTLTFDRSDSVTFAGVISGTGAVQQIGTGTTTLSAANTYSGGTLITAGLINFGANNNLGSGAITLNGGGLQWATGTATDISSRLAALGANGGTFDTNGNNVSFASPLSGAGGLIKAGAGILTVNVANSYSGGTVVGAGTLQISGSGMLGAIASATTVSGGTLDLGGTTQTQNGGLTLSGGTVQNGTLSSTGSFTLQSGTVSAVLAGSGSSSKTTSGTVTLSGANTYSGGTTISAGTLQLGAGGAAGSITGNVIDNGTLAFNRSDNVTFAGLISGSGSVRQAGSGNLIINVANTYSGGTTVSAGTLQISGSGTLGAIAGATTVSGGVLDLGGTTQTQNGGLTLSGGTVQNGTLSSTSSFALQSGTASAVLAGSGSMNKTTSGTATLSGANSYNGGTVVGAGTLQISGSGTLGAIAGATTVSGGTLDLGGTTQTQNGGLTLSGGTLQNGTLSSTSSFALQSGTTSAVLAGSGSVNKTTSGTATLSGANSYSGGTVVGAGTLQISGSGTLGAIASATTVSGGTLDLGGTTQTQNGGLTLSGGTLQNGTLSSTSSFALQSGTASAVLAGSGSVNKTTSGTATLSGANSYNGGTTVSAGTLQISGSGTLGNSANSTTVSGGVLDLGGTTQTQNGGLTLSGGTLQNGTLSSTSSFALQSGTASAVLAGSGSVSKTTSGALTLSAANTYSGGTTVSAGTLQISGSGTLGNSANSTTVSGGVLDLGGTTQTQNGGLTLSGGTIQNGTLSSGGNFALQSGTASAVLAGSGSLNKTTAGAVILSAANSYSGGTTISAGTLQLGAGGTTGSLIGNVVDNGTLAFNRSDTVTFASVISGSGAVQQIGTGTVTLSAANTYSGGTTIGAGTLNVLGTVGAVSVGNGGILTGTGHVGTTNVASGGTLSPGSGAPGTLAVAGNLTFASGANNAVSLTPSASGQTTVTGTASIDGTLTANAASGIYVTGKTYTLISATGGLSGTFASLSTPGLPVYVKGRLSYDANNAFLNLDNNTLSFLLSGGTSSSSNPSTGSSSTGGSANLISVGKAIDAVVESGTTPNSGIASLFTLARSNLAAALNQATGGIGAKTSQGAGQSFSPFFNVLMARGGASGGVSVASNGIPNGVKPAQLEEGATDIWGSIYAGHTGISADAATGAASLSSNAVGLALGIETMFADQFLTGGSIGLGHQSFKSGGGGNGRSDDIMVGLYGRETFYDEAYVSAAIGYGWHDVTTARIVTVSGTDLLSGKFNAKEFGGRVEAGFRFALDEQLGLTPFVAFAGESFHTPAYTETAVSGSTNFALSYAANDTLTSHTELGGKLGRDFSISGGTLSLEGLLGWAHQFSDATSAQAGFVTLPGSGFVLLGVKPAADAAMLGLDLQVHDGTGFVYGARVQSQIGPGTSSITGTLNLAYHW